MHSNLPSSSPDPAEEAWQKALRGTGLTPSECELIARSKGVSIQPKLPEPKRQQAPIPTDNDKESVARKIQQIVSPEKALLPRQDRKDLVTGGNVVNIPIHPTTDAEGMRLINMLDAAMAQTSAGRTVDMRSILDALERGPFPGFAELLDQNDRSKVHSADARLANVIKQQFTRLVLGDRVNEMLTKIDTALKQHIQPLVFRITNPQVRADVQEVLRIWDLNLRQNPYRNHYYRSQHAGGNPETKNIELRFAVPLMHLNKNYFSVFIMDRHIAVDNCLAGYESGWRTLMIRECQGPYNFLDTLGIAHETMHAIQHARALFSKPDISLQELENRQKQYTAAIYDPSQSPGDRQALDVLEDELDSIGMEVELLMARIGFGSHYVQDVMHMLGLPDDQAQHVYELLRYAAAYYNGRKEQNEHTPAFKTLIVDTYQRLGVGLLRRDADGFPVRN